MNNLRKENKFLGVDLGQKTIGLATAKDGFVFPKKTLYYKTNNIVQGVKKLLNFINEDSFDYIVFGYPLKLNNKISNMCNYVNLFINELKKYIINIKIILFDERYSSQHSKMLLEDLNITKKKDINKSINHLSAFVILKEFIERKRIKDYGKK